ncbi:MAG: ATP-binding cassette domain-containing protein [Burkholderiaceae bacterium]|nr:ATP-binding cassette domain-containing protein [Burkholderiaceae bacterium]
MGTEGHHVWRRFAVIARPYWLSEEKWKARGLLALAVLLLLGQTAFNVLLNEQTGEFTSALAARDADRFWLSIRQCVAIVVVAVPIYAFYYYVRDTLGILWRRWLTNRFLDRYFTDRAYYELNASGSIDNPDQRISEDINSFTQQSLYFLMIALGAVIQLAAFTGVLWSISRELVYFLVVYAVVGTVVTVVVFGRVLIGINFLQLRREADFRFGLVRIRENAEAIAFHRGEEQESFQAKQVFGAAFANYRRLLKAQLNLNLFQYAYSFLTIVLPSAIIASRVISGELEVGRAVQAAGAFAAILGAVAVIVDHFEGLSRFAAGIDRLGTFSKVLAGKEAARDDATGRIESTWGPQLALDHLTLQTPGRERTLIVDLSVSVAPGQGLMIVGDSGGGKSSLLRAIAGLWSAGAGRIVRPGPEETMFLPQQPYMVLGSLRSQLLYPDRSRRVSDPELLRLLERVNLADLAERFGGLDAELDWGKVLSIGEQQRLAFARVLLSRPRYVMLDEATSALDVGNEDLLYRELAATSTTPVSVSHHAALLKFHQQVLELTGNGSWRLHRAGDYRFR